MDTELSDFLAATNDSVDLLHHPDYLTRECARARARDHAERECAAIRRALYAIQMHPDSTEEESEAAQATHDAAMADWHTAWDFLWPDDEMEKARQKLAAEKAVFQQWLNSAAQIIKLPPGTPMPSNTHAPVTAPTIRNAASLLQREFSPVRYIVPGYLAEGCTILAGKPKIGKSWFVLDAALAVAGGNSGCMFGKHVEQGDVLYLALEDNERRLKTRIRKVLGPFEQGPERFTYAVDWPRAHEGGIDKIRSWIESVVKPTLVIVDVLQRIRTIQTGNQNAYAADYETVAELQKLASEKNVAVVVVHHLRKSAADSDPFDKVSGTLGLSGAADSILILDRDGQGTTLYGRGRDIEEIETAVQFDRMRCRWTALGAAPEVRRSDERRLILDVLKDGTAMSPSEIAAAAGMSAGNVRRLLFKMKRQGEITKIGTGYVSEVTSPVTPGNAGNGNANRLQIVAPPPY